MMMRMLMMGGQRPFETSQKKEILSVLGFPYSQELIHGLPITCKFPTIQDQHSSPHYGPSGKTVAPKSLGSFPLPEVRYGNIIFYILEGSKRIFDFGKVFDRIL